jgi:hypothetical protein
VMPLERSHAHGLDAARDFIRALSKHDGQGLHPIEWNILDSSGYAYCGNGLMLTVEDRRSDAP